MLVKCLSKGRHLKVVSIFNGVNRLRVVVVMRSRGTIDRPRLTFIISVNHLGYDESARRDSVSKRQKEKIKVICGRKMKRTFVVFVRVWVINLTIYHYSVIQQFCFLTAVHKS